MMSNVTNLVVTIRGDEADGGHHLDGLEHDQGHGGCDEPGQQVRASLWSNRFRSPTLLFMIAFRHLMHSSWNPIPLRITATRIKLVKTHLSKGTTVFSLSEALVEHVEDLLEALVAKVLDPVKTVVSEGDPERLDGVLLLRRGELGVGEELVERLYSARPRQSL